MKGNWFTKALHGQWLTSKGGEVLGIAHSVWATARDPDGKLLSVWQQCRSSFNWEALNLSTVSSAISHAQDVMQQKLTSGPAATSQISVDEDKHSLKLVSRSGWLLSSSFYVLAIGLLFLCCGIYFLNQATDNGSLFLLIGAVSSITGMLFFWAGFWSWGLRLEVCMTEDKLRVKRSFFDKSLSQHSLKMPDPDRIFAKRTSEAVSSDEISKEYFSLVIRRDGVTHSLAEGIDGRQAAEALQVQVQHWLKQYRRQHRKQFTAQTRHSQQLSEA